MNDPAQSTPIAKLIIDGVVYATYALDGVKGVLDAAANDGQPAWTLHNSAASHVPFEGDMYHFSLGSSANGIDVAELLALHQQYLLPKFGIPMSPPVPLAPTNTVAPTISGPPVIGQTVTTNPGVWAGYPAPTFTYQENRNGTPVSGATSSAYLLTAPDDTAMISSTVTATNASGSASVTTASVGPVTGVPTAPSNITPPTIAGTGQATFTLSVISPGAWNGYPAPTFTYQWQLQGVNISAATAISYLEQNSDVSGYLTCAVVATNASGSSTPAVSNAIGPIAAAPSYETEAAALFARSGTSFDAAHKLAINNWFVAVKNGATSGTNILSKLDCVNVYAVGTSHDALLDWKNTSRASTILNGTGVVFTADLGFKGTLATADYVVAGYDPSAGGVNYTQNSATLFEYVVADATDITSANAADLGWTRAYMVARTNSGLFQCVLNSTVSTYSETMGSSAIGSHCVTRGSSSQINVYHDGILSSQSPFSQTSASLSTGSMTVLTKSGSTNYGTRRLGATCEGGALNAAEVLDIHNAFHALLHAVGAI